MYDWGSRPFYHDNQTCGNMDAITEAHVPMVWGWWHNSQHPFTLTLPSNTRALLGFNEPNHKEQSGLTPEKAALAWPEVEHHAVGIPLVSPAAAPCGSATKCIGNTIEWFDRFFNACSSCRVDFLATHLYSCNAQHTMSVLHDLYQRYHRKIWLTEFSCPHTHDAHRQLQYMKDILPRLEAADYIHRYAWFVSRTTSVDGFITSSASLLQPHGPHLTELGRFYNNFQPHGASAVIG